jgi:hypothetical protein
MNKSPLTSILTGALGLSALVSLILCYMFIQDTREARSLQPQVMGVNIKRNIIMALYNDSVEYSKKNPSITPLLPTGVPSAPVKR